jgi:hypothetical protein
MDEDNCMVDIARYFMDFTQDESCGKCNPCRIGTRRLLEILTRICEGKGEPADLTGWKNYALKLALPLVRPGPGRPEPSCQHAAFLPRGIRGPHLREALPGESLPRADQVRHFSRNLHGLHRLRAQLPGERHYWRAAQSRTTSTPMCASAAASACKFATSTPSQSTRENSRPGGPSGLPSIYW